ncbi:MAG: aminotransferase class V-fold PLP-dependent enzyme [Pseudomonadota bacterium]
MTDYFQSFPIDTIGELTADLLTRVYRSQTVLPDEALSPAVIAESPWETDQIADYFRMLIDSSTGLVSGDMMGHMDTAPHPIAAFSDALVTALNNNLLFRELSPFASRVEEMLVDELAVRVGLDGDWQGTFVSGGSVANLTALFAATGGFKGVEQRSQYRFLLPACAHASLTKSLAVLGVGANQIVRLPSDAQGRSNAEDLEQALRESPGPHTIVVGVLGSTVHGAVEDVATVAKLCRQHEAWLHVDAIYGGALAFSKRNRDYLQGLSLADSVVVGPQKWMYTPRLSALIWIRGSDRFAQTLGTELPYSATGESHRGQWGLQGSRRADAVTLYAVLCAMGTNALGELIDSRIDLCRQFHNHLADDEHLFPTHHPDLNLQCFAFREPNSVDLDAVHARLGRQGVPWVSLSKWGDRRLLRAVILSPNTDDLQLQKLLTALHSR